MPLNVYYDEFQPSWEEEGLFARDVNGHLVRVVDASEQDYFQQVTVTIDGQAIRVPRAVPTTDAQGNIVYLDAAGRTRPRRTTLSDAALAARLVVGRGECGDNRRPAASGKRQVEAAANDSNAVSSRPPRPGGRVP